MAYDESLADRVRAVLQDKVSPPTETVEKKMFGGVAFMVGGNMCCGVNTDDLMLRVGADGHNAALRRPHARPMDFTGRPMKSMVFVGAAGTERDADLRGWIDTALDFVRTLPPK